MLKIYTTVQKHYNNSDVGVMMFSNDDLCFQSAFKVVNTEEAEGHLFGIKRALSYIKNIRPTYKLENIEFVFKSDEKRWIDLRIREDRYIRNVKHLLNVNISIKEPTTEDYKKLKLTEQQYLLQSKNNNEGR